MFTVYYPQVQFMDLWLDCAPTAKEPENYTATKQARIVRPGWQQDKNNPDIFWPTNGQFHNPDNPERANCYSLNKAIEEGVVEIL